jgi:tRNA pseudouridine13 synthase
MPDLHFPPLLTAHLPSVGGRIGPAPEHFVVEELALYDALGTGDHWYVYVQKRDATTQDLVQAVARAAGVRAADVGSAGMKDKHAVTSQWLSVPTSGRAPEAWDLPDAMSVLAVSRHKNKLRTGHLRANRFRITLVDVPLVGDAQGLEAQGLEAQGLEAQGLEAQAQHAGRQGVGAGGSAALERARSVLQALSEQGLPNYYGPQRFGRDGSSFWQALRHFARPTDAGEGQAATRRRGGHRDHQRAKLLSSVLQAEVFNRYLTLRLERAEPLLRGEVVRLEGSSRHFVVESPDEERPRLEQGDIHRTGPLPGPRTVQAAAEAADLEKTAASALELDERAWAELGRAAPGARRDLVVRPEELTVEALAPDSLLLSFVLPSGSYATQLVRELTRAPWLEPRSPSAERRPVGGAP